jgi:hypothetical protein
MSGTPLDLTHFGSVFTAIGWLYWLHSNGYKVVQTVDPRDGKAYRFTGVIKQVIGVPNDEAFARHVETTGHGSIGNGAYLALERAPIDGLSVRYGVTWDDISTREDREHWIAGSSIKVIDLQTREVVAERTGYLIDTGQGSTSGFRSPWGWAKSYAPRCPPKEESTLNFAARVLKPSTQEPLAAAPALRGARRRTD